QRTSKATTDPNGCCSTTSISSCTSSCPRRAPSTASSACGGTPSRSRSRRPDGARMLLSARCEEAFDILHSALRAAADSLLSVVLSPCCAACGQLLDHPTLGPVCESCWRSILPLTPPLCD